MKIKHAYKVPAEPVEGLPGVTVRWLWAAQDEAPNFALRLFEVQPGESTFYHTHPHEHEVFVLSGQAVLRGKDGEQALGSDDTVLIRGNEEHQIVNAGESLLRFLCAVPLHP
jgi:quercetin dioxygenase-like cupin family protein